MSPEPAGPLGIDVSNHQERIDWKRVAKAKVLGEPVSFAFLKASERTEFLDQYLHANARAAAAAGIPCGAYHYARPDLNPGLAGARREADFFLQAIENAELELLPVLDFEEPRAEPLGARALRMWAVEWLRVVGRELGCKPIFYTYPSYYTDTLGNSRAPRLAQHPFWLASYGENDGREHAFRVVGPWERVAIHQFTSNGRLPGISGAQDIDLNRLHVPLDELRLPSAG